VSVVSRVSSRVRVFWVEASSERIWVMVLGEVVSGGAVEAFPLDEFGRRVFESDDEAMGGEVGV
jgi:hypothetical protein